MMLNFAACQSTANTPAPDTSSAVEASESSSDSEAKASEITSDTFDKADDNEAQTEDNAAEATTEGGKTASTDEQTSSVSPTDIFASIQADVDLISPVEMSDDFLENYYGIDLSLVDSYVCSMSEEATSAETVFIVKLTDSQNSDAISSCVSMVKDDKAAEMQDYLPEQYDIVEKSTVSTSGDYVWLVISENADKINSIIEESIKSK